MPRIRTLKPSFWSDARVAALGREARLLTIGLISYADDDGRFVATPAAIRGYIYPFDHITDTKIERWLAEIDKTGLLVLYRVSGLTYGYFPRWIKNQRIDRATPSTIPEPFPQNFVTDHEDHYK